MEELFIPGGTKVNWGESYQAMAINQETHISHITDVVKEDSIVRVSKDYVDGNAEKVDERDISEHIMAEQHNPGFFIDYIIYSTQGHYLVGYVGHFDTFGV